MKTESGKNATTVKMSSDREVVVTRTFDAPARLVFEAWSKPELFRAVVGAAVAGRDAEFVRARRAHRRDVSPGVRRRSRDTMAFFGRYLEVVPNSRIVWTNDEDGESTHPSPP